MNKKNIVIVSTFFPPIQHIASNRIWAYAKYLSKYYSVTVITLGSRGYEKKIYFNNQDFCHVVYLQNNWFWEPLLFYTGKEKSLLRFFKTSLRVIFTQLGISFYKGWSLKAKKFLDKYLQNNKVDVVLSSYAPEDALTVVYESLVARGAHDIKWVLDMRDEYSDELGLSKWEVKRRRKNEKVYSKKADLVVSVSRPLLDLFRERMPDAKDFLEVRNGFDHEFKRDFSKEVEYSYMKIGYFGSFHGDAKPDNVFKALERLRHLPIKFYIATKNTNFDIPKQLEDRVILLSYMSYIESIKKMASMDCNILILPSEKRVGVYSGKLFDYISVQRSVLALVNKHDVATELISEMSCGYISNLADIEMIVSTIKEIYEDWKKDSLPIASEQEIKSIARQSEVDKLVYYMNKNWVSND